MKNYKSWTFIQSSLTLALLSATLILAMSGCESSTDETNSQAQSCMDKASTGQQAATCMALVSGRSDQQAYQIDCSAMFLEWGFSTAKFAAIIQTVQNNPNGQNAALNMLAGLPLIGTNPITGSSAANDVNTISSLCQATQDPGLTMLSQFLVMSTNVAELGATITNGQLDVTSAKTILASLTSNSANSQAIGTAAVTIYNSYCGGGTGSSTVCTAINKAVGGNVTPGSVAVALGQYLQSQ